MMTMTDTAATDTMTLTLRSRTAAQSLRSTSQAKRQGKRSGRTRLTVRGRVVLLLLATFISWFGWSEFSTAPAYSESGAMEVQTYTVRPGDTLWSYAADITPANRDVSERVDEIMQLNHLDSPVLHPGQVIVVPQQQG